MYIRAMLLLLMLMPGTMLYAAEPKDVLANKMAVNALNTFNPAFRIWDKKDYLPGIRTGASKNEHAIQFLKSDFNGDGVADFVLDGHDGKRSLLLALISKNKGYQAGVIHESEYAAPETIEAWENGKKQKGLNHYMWLHKNGKGFTLASPQQEDKNGELLYDGSVVEYIFRNGAFEEELMIL